MSRTDLADPLLIVLYEIHTSLLSRVEAITTLNSSLCHNLVLRERLFSCNWLIANAFFSVPFYLSLCIGWRQMKADVSRCWLCLSDMFCLIPSPRVVPVGPCFHKQPPEPEERWQLGRRTSTEQQSLYMSG